MSSGISLEQHKRFKAKDIVGALEDLKGRCDEKQKLAVFWDNASIHTAQIVKQKAKELKIKLVFNLPHRSELLGITYLWNDMKS